MKATLLPDSVTPNEKEEALERVLRSKAFARSEQLKSFLRFICEADRNRPGVTVNEALIGVEVLGRPQGYSPAEDSSVRTRAYELRHKLDLFYKGEGIQEGVQIVVPKGSYTPFFSRVPSPSTPLIAPPVEGGATHLTDAESTSKLQVEARQRSIPMWPAAQLIGALCCLLVGLLIGSKIPARSAVAASQNDRSSVLAEAWGPLANHDSSAILCAATPLSLVVGPAGHDVYHSRSYPVPPETYALFREHRLNSSEQQLGLTFSDNMVGVGTVSAALACSRVLRQFGAAFQFLPERAATASALRGRNAVLFGAPVDSEAIARILQDMPLTVEYQPDIHEFAVRDRSEKCRRPLFSPQKDRSGQFTSGYGLITVLHSHEADREPTETVIFSGITSIGIQGATEFFCSKAAMEHLRLQFVHEGCKGFPAAYQVVVRCTFSNQLLLGSIYEAHKIVDKDLPSSL